MPLPYLLNQAWSWFASTGINLAIIIVLALLVPRIGRFAERLVEREVTARQADQDSKASLAFAGVGVYIGEAVAYFILVVLFLQQIGFSLAGAAIPATVVSAAVGFGAQSIIADFLAGFFLLSEKQYGVGDWVRFTGNGVEVEGSVISITMRATTIRTLKQETVTIPNSTARVSINTSNYWSRAVVVMSVPLRGEEGPSDVVARAETATRRALERPEIAAELIGDLDVHPATGITAPTTEGMPWTMDVRFMIQVKAGSQWLVERAIRMEVLDEFWSEYSFAPLSSGEALDEVSQALTATLGINRGNEDAPTEQMRKVGTGDPSDTETRDTEVLDAGSTAADDTETKVLKATGAVEAAGATGERSDEGHNPVPEKLAHPDGSDPAGEAGPEVDQDPTPGPDADAEDAAPEGEEDNKAPWWKTVWFEFRHMRRSTAWFLGILVVLLIAKPLFFSTENAEGERIAGIFAPPVGGVQETAEETVPPEEETDSVDPTGTEQPTPTDGATPQATTPTGTAGQTTPTQPTAEPQEPGEADQPQQRQATTPAEPTAPTTPATPIAPEAPGATGGTATPADEAPAQQPDDSALAPPAGGTGDTAPNVATEPTP